MGKSNRTKDASFASSNVQSAIDMRTVEHIKELEKKEYLAMKDAMIAGGSCKSCIDFKQLRFIQECKFFTKEIKHYNICKYYKAAASGERKVI